jgi:hypothetical protein
MKTINFNLYNWRQASNERPLENVMKVLTLISALTVIQCLIKVYHMVDHILTTKPNDTTPITLGKF